jgi:hypothetical protein
MSRFLFSPALPQHASVMPVLVERKVRWASFPYGSKPVAPAAANLQPKTPPRPSPTAAAYLQTPPRPSPTAAAYLQTPPRPSPTATASLQPKTPTRPTPTAAAFLQTPTTPTPTAMPRRITITTLAQHQTIEGRTFDARVLHDPRNKQLRAHCGYHPAIIAGICSHRRLPSLLRDIKMHLQSSPADVHIGLQCRSGKHRSVAMASILENIIGEKIEVHHANANAWRDDCRTGRCHSCNSPADYEAVLAIWQEL